MESMNKARRMVRKYKPRAGENIYHGVRIEEDKSEIGDGNSQMGQSNKRNLYSKRSLLFENASRERGRNYRLENYMG